MKSSRYNGRERDLYLGNVLAESLLAGGALDLYGRKWSRIEGSVGGHFFSPRYEYHQSAHTLKSRNIWCI